MSFWIQNVVLSLVSIYRVRIRGSDCWKGPQELFYLNHSVMERKLLRLREVCPESQIIRPGLLWMQDQEEGHGRMNPGENIPLPTPHPMLLLKQGNHTPQASRKMASYSHVQTPVSQSRTIAANDTCVFPSKCLKIKKYYCQ